MKAGGGNTLSELRTYSLGFCPAVILLVRSLLISSCKMRIWLECYIAADLVDIKNHIYTAWNEPHRCFQRHTLLEGHGGPPGLGS
ncbi:hypothetical protein BJX65DRAFT_276421 [Aspergillus insuetus]